ERQGRQENFKGHWVIGEAVTSAALVAPAWGNQSAERSRHHVGVEDAGAEEGLRRAQVPAVTLGVYLLEHQAPVADAVGLGQLDLRGAAVVGVRPGGDRLLVRLLGEDDGRSTGAARFNADAFVERLFGLQSEEPVGARRLGMDLDARQVVVAIPGQRNLRGRWRSGRSGLEVNDPGSVGRPGAGVRNGRRGLYGRHTAWSSLGWFLVIGSGDSRCRRPCLPGI